jgi:hypothetical protein
MRKSYADCAIKNERAAFPTLKVMMKYLQEIAWETEVWVAKAPNHLIYFRGAHETVTE